MKIMKKVFNLIKRFFKWYINYSRDYYAIKCPKCGSKNINTVKESSGNAFKRNFWTAMFLIRLLWVRKPANLHVCKDCGFSWEDRK